MNSIEEMLRQAEQMGMAGIAITDHSPGTDNTVQFAQNKEYDYHWSQRIKGPDTHYFKVLISRYQAPEEIKVRLFKGIECNILGEGMPVVDIPTDLVSKFDLVIASVHPIPFLFEFRSQGHLTERIVLAMDESIDIVGHPFHRNYESSDQEFIIKTAAEKNVALELNNSSLRLKKAQQTTMLKMLELAKKHDCRISLASDSHVANELGGDGHIRPLLEQVHFPGELIVNNTLEDATAFVEERKKIRAERQTQINA
jgi:histidinol phosphatase-like PHP family hydrolase